MTATYNRYTVNILATADATENVKLLAALNAALKTVPKFNVKAINLDKWADGFTGEERVFDEKGNEIGTDASTSPAV